MKYADRVARFGGDGADAWELHYEALQAQESDAEVIVLSVGDPDLDTPSAVVESAVTALRAGDTHYTPCIGRDELRRAVAAEIKTQGGPDYKYDQTGIVLGAQNALFMAAQCILSDGDEVITLDPMYVTYEAFLGASGATLRRVPCDESNGFRPDAQAIAAAVNSNTRAIAFSNPCNPSGAVFTHDELQAIVDIAVEHDLWILSDEVYATLCFEHSHTVCAALPGAFDRTVTIGSLSKSHAMTGWRVGWLAGPKELIGHIDNLSLCMLYGLPGFVQTAAIEALTHSRDESVTTCKIYQRRKQLVVSSLSKIDRLKIVNPEAGMFMLIDVRNLGLSSAEFCRQLFDQKKVSLLDGAAFAKNTNGFVRLSFAVGDQALATACRRIEDFIAGLPS